MESGTKTVYVVDVYNPYLSPKTIRSVFCIHGRKFCIREVPLLWGKPQIGYIDDDFMYFHLYDTLEDAQNYVKILKKLEGMKL